MHSYLQYMFDYMGYSPFTTNLHGLPEGDSVDEWVSYRVYILNWDSFEYKKRATFQTSCHLWGQVNKIFWMERIGGGCGGGAGWLDLAKFRHFGKTLKSLLLFVEGLFCIGRNFKPNWANFYDVGQIFIVVNDPILKT